MRINNLFIWVLLAGICFSCSSDEIPGVQVPEVKYDYDAVLSLSIADTHVVSKAFDPADGDADYRKNDFIKRLSVAVFSTDGNLLSFKEDEIKEPDATDKSLTGIAEIETVSGNVQVLVLANYDLGEKYKKTYVAAPGDCAKLADYETLRVNLDDEINGSLTMSSDLMNVALIPGKNELGGSGEGKKPIPLYRNVSRVYLSNVQLAPKTEYANEATLTFNSVFLVNVKSKSRLFCPDASRKQGSVEVTAAEEVMTGKDFWYCGVSPDEDYIPNFAATTGGLKLSEATSRTSLFYDFNYYMGKTMRDVLGDYPHVNYDLTEKLGYNNLGNGQTENPYDQLVEDSENTKLGSGKKNHGTGGGEQFPIGMFFHCYENMKSEVGYQTLLVLRGTYTYKDNGNTISKDGYYTVTVNKDGASDDTVDGVPFKLVRRNYKYAIGMVIKGPGSTTPFDKDLETNVSTSIKVEDWNVRKIVDSVE